jgi:predicted nucleic acid-binding protein
MIIVSNTTPLIAFSSLQKFDLLKKLFGKLYIAEAVYHEATIAKKEKDNLAFEIAKADWIQTIKVKDRLAVDVLLDELDLAKIGTIGLLVKAKEIGLLSEIKPEIKTLTETSFNLSESVINTVLQQANEL